MVSFHNACAGMGVTPGGRDESLVPDEYKKGQEVEIQERIDLLVDTTTSTIFSYIAQVCDCLPYPWSIELSPPLNQCILDPPLLQRCWSVRVQWTLVYPCSIVSFMSSQHAKQWPFTWGVVIKHARHCRSASYSKPIAVFVFFFPQTAGWVMTNVWRVAGPV